VHRIAISGLVALAAVLGGIAVPATAMAQPRSAVGSLSAVAARMAVPARMADELLSNGGSPAISCVLATDCLAIQGSSGLGGGQGPAVPTRVARWNGSSWKGVRVALPKGAKLVDLAAVSCRGAKSCLVVGDYYKSNSDSGGSYPLALIYNGTSLKPMPALPLPKGQPNVALSDVSCATTRSCVAIGLANGNPSGLSEYSDGISFIEAWNGAKWTLHTIATSATTTVAPGAVSCATPSFCVLTGDVTSVSGSSVTVELYLGWWNGKKLTRMKAAAAGGVEAVPTGVSCATTVNCAVTGTIFGSTLSIRGFTQVWNGKAWQVAKTTWPKGVAESILSGVSCYGAHSCESVGLDGAKPESTPVDAAAVSYHGTAGTVQAVPKPSKGYSNTFTAVSCLPWGSCVAVGDTGKNTAVSPAAMTGVWNGKTWKLDPGL
jgi:hypothetical protein